jgi:hypothetical protein
MCNHENVSLATSASWQAVCADCGAVVESVAKKGPKMGELLEKLQAIEELNCVLRNWCSDDDKSPADYTPTELLELARERRAVFYEQGHSLHEAMQGDLGPAEKRYANSQLAKINRFIQAASSGV